MSGITFESEQASRQEFNKDNLSKNFDILEFGCGASSLELQVSSFINKYFSEEMRDVVHSNRAFCSKQARLWLFGVFNFRFKQSNRISKLQFKKFLVFGMSLFFAFFLLKTHLKWKPGLWCHCVAFWRTFPAKSFSRDELNLWQLKKLMRKSFELVVRD